MKKTALILWIILCGACSTTMITGSWKSPSSKSKSYENILVAALTNHAVAKATVENDLASMLNKYEIKATKSIDLFPPEVSNSDSDRTTIMHKVHGKNIDAILTISLLKKETVSRYVPNEFSYDPLSRYDYYGSFWGYYSYWYPYSYSPGYYSEKLYYVETNLYDAKTEALMWSVQSITYDILDLPKFSREFAKTIADKLKRDGIIVKKK